MIDSRSRSVTHVANIKRHEPYDVYAARLPKHKASHLGNIYRVGIDGSRDDVIGKFAYDLRLKWRIEPDNEEFRRAVFDTHGKTLGCHCSPENCHAEVIAAFVDTYHDQGEVQATNVLAFISQYGLSAYKALPEVEYDREPGI